MVLRLRWYIVYRTRNVWLYACVSLWFIERGILHFECAFLGFCACVGLWFIERGILHLECAFLGFCACVGLWFIERRILHLECAFLGFCPCVGLWFIEREIITVGVRFSCRADRTDRTNRIALCLDVITRCTLRMSTDCTYGSNEP